MWSNERNSEYLSVCEKLPIDTIFSLAILGNRCKPLNLNDPSYVLVGLLLTGGRDTLRVDATALKILWNEDCRLLVYKTKHIHFSS